MTPAPTMRSDSGTVCKAKASVEVKIAGCEKSNIGKRAGSEPVAMITLSASTVTVPPPDASPRSTTTMPGPASRPVPRSTSTPAFLSSASTFSRRRVTMPSLRSIMRTKSGLISPATSNPYSCPARARESASALASRALVGMQPQLRQVPPMRVALDERDLRAVARGSQRGDVPARAATDDDDLYRRAFLRGPLSHPRLAIRPRRQAGGSRGRSPLCRWP